MPIDATALVGGALGGAVAQAALGPYFGQRNERRTLRANVVRQIAVVENLRWAPAPKEEFLEAVHALRSAALIAGLKRELVEVYLLLAAAGRQKSGDSLELAGGDIESGGGGISTPLAELVLRAASALTDYAWHPFNGRFRLRRSVKKLTSEKDEVTAQLNKRHPAEHLHWDIGLPKVIGP